ncbi:MAG: MT-A70 family methyltransferase [Dehalococcoidales bacterium]|nr:MT-A70 family methyltransferase [Dehalococcoidales bacterium]
MSKQHREAIEWLNDPGLLHPNGYSEGIYGENGFRDLLDSIKNLGILQPLHVTVEGKIISGHRRWRAARVAYQEGIPVLIPVIRECYASESDECQAVIEFNRYRIKTGQQLYNEGKALKEIEAVRARERQATSTGGPIPQLVENFPQAEGRTRDIIAQSIGLGSGRQWDKLEYVAEHKPQLLNEIKPDGMSIHKAYDATRREVSQVAINPEPELPEGIFQVFYMDPPWQYNNSGLGGSAENHYRTRTVDEMLNRLKELNFASHTAPACVLFLWATNPLLPEALRLIGELGFQYKTNLTWVKDKPTYGKLGFYVYGQHELLLLATQGSMLPKGDKPASVICAEVRDHSRKPEVVYEIIDQMYPNTRKCELFGREHRFGWEVWGDQVSKEAS